ncbi:MAG TPA: DUF2283 domain-containing protein [Candidatus Brocadiaceae bacterium]|nr:DUF2283 domain-containing protein [Candidatus Brocadiaceae bacterium]
MIKFHEKRKEVESIKISDGLVIDMAPDGTIYGIEMLNANEQIKEYKPRRGGRMFCFRDQSYDKF